MSPGPSAKGAEEGPRYHVVLIGIDAYQGVSPLSGCVNDIDAIQELLRRRLGLKDEWICRLAAPRFDDTVRPTEIPTQPPTRKNILAALRAVAAEAGAGDKVFIYYSGHGTQLEIASPDGGHFVREALVPSDDKVLDPEQGGWKRQYLFDWELNEIFRLIAARTSQITVILDCCNSAGATRSLAEPGARDRFAPSEAIVRLREVDASALQRSGRSIASGLAASIESCMVVAACRDDERARESLSGSETAHGELTRALLAHFEGIEDAELAELRWSRIWRSVESAVNAANPCQNPWLSSSSLRRVFCGPPEDGDAGYPVSSVSGNASGVYHIGAGQLAGITRGARIAVYPAEPQRFPELGSSSDLEVRWGVLQVVRADRNQAEAELLETSRSEGLPPGARGRLIQPGEEAKLVIAISPPDPELQAELAQSSFLRLAEPGEQADATLLLRSDDQWALCDDTYGSGEEAGVPSLPCVPRQAYDAAVALAEQYRLFTAPLRFARRCSDRAQALQLSLLDCNGLEEPPDSETAAKIILPEARRGPRADYELRAGTVLDDLGDRYCLRIDNKSSDKLFVTVLNCEADGSVMTLADRVYVRPGGHAIVWHPYGPGEWLRTALMPLCSLGIERFIAIGTNDRGPALDYLNVESTFEESIRPSSQTRVAGTRSAGAPAEVWTATVVTARVESLSEEEA